MAYPVDGASYRNKPAWMDRAVKGEKRAQGGPVEDVDVNERGASFDLNRAMRQNVSNEDETPVRKNARGRLSSDPFEAMASGAYANKSRTKNWDGDYSHRGQTAGVAKPKSVANSGDEVEGYAKGGRVRRRADGGPLVDPKGFAIDDTSQSAFGPPQRFSKASSPQAADDAREQAAGRTRRTRAMPNSFPVGGEPKEDKVDQVAKAGIIGGTLGGVGKRIGAGLGQSIGFKRGGTAKRAAGGPVEGTDAYYADQERKNGVPESKRNYGDPVPASTPLPKRDPRGYQPRPKYMDGKDVWPDLPTRKKNYP